MLQKVLQRMLRMCPTAWEYMIRSLQLCCLLLFCSLVLLLACEGRLKGDLYIQAAAFQEYAQVSLLLATIVPVCLEDLLGSNGETPPGSSRR